MACSGKSKEYLKTGMKLKDRPAMLVALFRNTCGEDYAQDIHLHPFYIIHSHEDFIERFMKRPDENEEGRWAKIRILFTSSSVPAAGGS